MIGEEPVQKLHTHLPELLGGRCDRRFFLGVELNRKRLGQRFNPIFLLGITQYIGLVGVFLDVALPVATTSYFEGSHR